MLRLNIMIDEEFRTDILYKGLLTDGHYFSRS